MLFIASCNRSKYEFIRINYPGYLNTTSYVIVEVDTLATTSKKVEKDIRIPLEEILKSIEQTFSTSADSFTSRINKLAGTNTFTKMPSDFNYLLSLSLEINSKIPSFDVTSGALTALWNISSRTEYCYNSAISKDNPYCTLPTHEDIQKALKGIGSKNIEIKENAIHLSEGTSLDFGAVAKGYACDLMKELLIEKGYSFFVINLGGNVFTYGKSKKYSDAGEELKVSIENPIEDSLNLLDIYTTNEAIVTTGIDKRYIEVENKKYHHILDTSTGYPIDNELEAVVVIMESSTYADLYSTALYTLGLDAITFMETNGIKGIIVTKNKEVYIIGNIEYKQTNNNFTFINRK